MNKIRKTISAGVPLKALRDVTNRLRFGPDAPQSDELIWIRPRDVENWYKPDPKNGAPRFRRRHSGMVAPGNWDRSTSPFGSHLKLNSIRQHFENGVPWEETKLFGWMLQQIEEKGRIDGCRNREELLDRYRRLDRIYDETKRTGRLRPHGSVNETRREHGGILVHINRNGTPLRDGGGMHRFAIAYSLDLEKVPAQLGVIHPDAVRSGVLKNLRQAPD
ncbi:hypothetical protein [Marivita hallyeonensis]|uniref:Uncharacterized protein n=1 Tax=Marivita hallyeonensis TaxID=996342 RepID=A0A1M5WAN0_9RHOB|nr:hypothetical protein [Marivita hallyeonensis]SHH84536.1 hypothetical protein SAMN05443551_3352 [Marivita hallyeonensis]